MAEASFEKGTPLESIIINSALELAPTPRQVRPTGPLHRAYGHCTRCRHPQIPVPLARSLKLVALACVLVLTLRR